MRFSSESGQSTVEAAFLIPVLFAVFGLFLQPGILLYNRCIMSAAAAEGCRLLATNTADDASIRAFMERRLSSIPKLDIFHTGEQWEVNWSNAGENGDASVSIVNHAKPLPLIGLTAYLTEDITQDGLVEQKVESQASVFPSWARSAGTDASTWIGDWK